MADVYPDRQIDMRDTAIAAKNFGKSGNYITDIAGVSITFNTGQAITPDPNGFVTIPKAPRASMSHSTVRP